MDLFRSTMKPVKKVLEDADLAKSDIDEIVLVGGSTRIPKVQQLVKVRTVIFSRSSLLTNCTHPGAILWVLSVVSHTAMGNRPTCFIHLSPILLVVNKPGWLETMIRRNSVSPLSSSRPLPDHDIVASRRNSLMAKSRAAVLTPMRLWHMVLPCREACCLAKRRLETSFCSM